MDQRDTALISYAYIAGTSEPELVTAYANLFAAPGSVDALERAAKLCEEAFCHATAAPTRHGLNWPRSVGSCSVGSAGPAAAHRTSEDHKHMRG